MMTYPFRKKSIDIPNTTYIVTFLLLCFDSFEFFFRSVYLIPLLTVFCLIIFFNKKRHLNNEIVFMFCCFIFVFILQWLQNDSYKFTSVISRTFTLFSCYIIANVIKDKFLYALVNILLLISIVSIVIYLLALNDGIRHFFINIVAPKFVSLNVDTAKIDG